MDLYPKITDVGSLKGISFLLALPLLCVAYTFQSGAVIGWNGDEWISVPKNAPQDIQFNWLVLIFIIKSIWISFWGMMAYGLLGLIHAELQFPILPFVSALLISFGLFGVFGMKTFQLLGTVNPFWFYASIVWGLFLQAMCDPMPSKGT